MSIRGFPSLKKIVNLIAGYTEEQSVPHNEFVTVSPIASNKKALDVKSVAITDISGADLTPDSMSGRVISLVAHGGLPGDIIKFLSGTNELMEVGILSTPDADTIIIDADIVISVSDTFRIFRAITPNVDASGNFTVAQGPLQFLKNGVSVQVTEDTVTPANNIPLPVKLTDITGDVSITAHNLNVQLSDQGANPDVTRIGDGTNQLAITAGNAAKVDGSAVTQPVSAASLPLPSGAATEAKQDTGNTSLSSIDGKLTTLNAKDFATSAKQDTGNTSLLNIDGKLPSNLTVTSTRLLVDGSGVTQPISGSVSVSNFPATQPVSGSVSVSNFPATQPVSGTVDIGTLPSIPAGTNSIGKVQVTDTTNTRILALTAVGEVQSRIRDALGNELLLTSNQEAKVKDVGLPAALGQLAMAASTSVTIANNQTAIPTSTSALTASFQEVLNLTTVAQTVTPPASAKWVKIYADNTNSNNIRVRLAGTATTSSGISMEPGRTEDFQVVGTAISIIAEAGTNQKINFHFGA